MAGIPLGSFPSFTALDEATQEERWQRFIQVACVCSVLLAVTLAFVLARTHCCGPPKEDSGEEEGRFGLYGATDMRVVVYHSLLVVAVFSAALYSGLTGRVSLRTGLDYEIYVCVMVEVLVSTTVSAVFKKVGLLKALMMVAPFSARFDLLRDATIVAVFIQVGNEQSSIWPLLAAAVVPLMNLLSFLVVLEDRADFVELRDSFWAKTAAPRPWLKDQGRILQAADASDAEWSPMLEEGQTEPSDKEMPYQHRFLLYMGDATSHAKQVKSFYEQIPQASISTAVLLTVGKDSLALVFGAGSAWLQAGVIYLVRPYVLCLQANRGLSWKGTCSRDFDRARSCAFWSQHGLAALAFVTLDEENSPAVRQAALDAFNDEVNKHPVDRYRDLRAYVFQGLVTMEAVEIIEHFPAEVMSEEDSLTVAAGKAKKWQLLASILKRCKKANVNFMEINQEILHNKLLPYLKDSLLPLEYVNLNDNKELCTTEEGVQEVLNFMEKCPQLQRLRLQRTGIGGNPTGKKKLQEKWQARGLVLKNLELDD